MKPSITIRFRDEGHLRAHVDHFTVPLDRALGWVRERLAAWPQRSGWAHFDFSCPEVVGLTGLQPLGPEGLGAFWARRRGRTLPSHLIVGEKSPTRDLCVWGFWDDEETFVLHTLYPGKVAPREIHDPELALADLGASIAFWTSHAIVVSAGEWDE